MEEIYRHVTNVSNRETVRFLQNFHFSSSLRKNTCILCENKGRISLTHSIIFSSKLFSSGAKQREALRELSKNREHFYQVASVLWKASDVVTALLEEVIAICPLLSPAQLTAHVSNQSSNVCCGY